MHVVLEWELKYILLVKNMVLRSASLTIISTYSLHGAESFLRS